MASGLIIFWLRLAWCSWQQKKPVQRAALASLFDTSAEVTFVKKLLHTSLLEKSQTSVEISTKDCQHTSGLSTSSYLFRNPQRRPSYSGKVRYYLQTFGGPTSSNISYWHMYGHLFDQAEGSANAFHSHVSTRVRVSHGVEEGQGWHACG